MSRPIEHLSRLPKHMRTLRKGTSVETWADIKRQVAACFVLEGADGAIKGYYILSADRVNRTLIPEGLAKKIR